MMLRFHTQTAGVQLTAQQPEVNLVRVTVQALAAVLGGTQSLHTNSYDEAIALPTEKAARLALRTQQVLAHETDLTATVDPFAGLVRGRVDDRRRSRRSRDDSMHARRRLGVGGRGHRARASRRPRSSARRTRSSASDRRRRTCCGGRESVHPRRRGALPERGAGGSDVREAKQAIEACHAASRARSSCCRCAALKDVQSAARSTGSVLYPLKRGAPDVKATVGEVCDALRDVWGTIPADGCLATAARCRG